MQRMPTANVKKSFSGPRISYVKHLGENRRENGYFLAQLDRVTEWNRKYPALGPFF